MELDETGYVTFSNIKGTNTRSILRTLREWRVMIITRKSEAKKERKKERKKETNKQTNKQRMKKRNKERKKKERKKERNEYVKETRLN
jgi:hypothetical protein